MDPMSVYPFRHSKNTLEDSSPNVTAMPKRPRRNGTNSASSKTEEVSQRITRSQSQGKDSQLQLRAKRQSVVLMDDSESEKTQTVSKKALPGKEKRKAADTVAEFGPKRYREAAKSDEKRPRILKELEPPIEFTRDEAFELGNKYRIFWNNNKLHEIFTPEELERALPKKTEKSHAEAMEDCRNDPDFAPVADIAEHCSEIVGSQLWELFNICEEAGRPSLYKKIRKFALALAQELPRKETKDSEEAQEIDPKFMDIAREFSNRLPGHGMDKDQLNKLAVRLQELQSQAIEEVDEGDEDDEIAIAAKNDEQERAISDEEKQVSRVLGHLTLLAQKDIKIAAACIETGDKDESIQQILGATQEIFTDRRTKIEEHASDHKRTTLQESEEAQYNRMTLEMAKLLLLESGGLNHGIIDDVVEALVPASFKNTLMVSDMKYLLKVLKEDPSHWMGIGEAEKPGKDKLATNDLLRAMLDLDPKEPLTDNHARLAIIMALCRPLRQAKAGTCFATAWLIKLTNNSLEHCIMDYVDLIKNGEIRRKIYSEERGFPYHARLPKESLDNVISVDEEGRILSVFDPEESPAAREMRDKPAEDAFIYQAPGIRAACKFLDIADVRDAVMNALVQFPDGKFSINDLLLEIAREAHARSESKGHALRSVSKQSLEELHNRALYAFGAQTNNALHRAWEQVAATMVNYFGSEVMFPHWTYEAMQKTFKKMFKTEDTSFKHHCKLLLEDIFLHMIYRMRYRYNHNIEDKTHLFLDKPTANNHGDRFYGYELCDAGLPADFKYDKTLLHYFKHETSHFYTTGYTEYSSSDTWKLVDTEEKFQDFIGDIVLKTAEYLKEKTDDEGKQAEWDRVSAKIVERVHTKTFTKQMTERILGPESEQKRKLKKNDFTMATRPWKFKWGGDPDEVIKTFWNFKEYPVRNIRFIGTQREVLTRILRAIRDQKDDIKELFADPHYMTPITSTNHAFNLTPADPTVQAALEAVESGEYKDLNDYIQDKVQGPGEEVANEPLSEEIRNQLVDYVCNNSWVSQKHQKHVLLLQELTEYSKNRFDELMEEMPPRDELTVDEFQKYIYQAVIQSRKDDPEIGKRNYRWERRFHSVLQNKVKEICGGAAKHRIISQRQADSLINFARNRVEDANLSVEESAAVREAMEDVPLNVSAKDFRQILIATAANIRKQTLGGRDKGWAKKLGPELDSKLFKLLPEETKAKLFDSIISPADTNWHDGIHYIRFAWMVNPGTGKMELCRYFPDTEPKKMVFFAQPGWFPNKKKYGKWALRWEMPDNYRVWKNQPLFDMKDTVGS